MLRVTNYTGCTLGAVILIDDAVAKCCCHFFEGLLLGFTVEIG
jgi:hypothetical protein